MAPTDDVERPRASSAAERQKSIVSMTEFEGMDEYTALQKYILFYRDARTNPHAEKAPKKKAWWQFWKSGSATAQVQIADPGAVPDECKHIQFHQFHSIARRDGPASPCQQPRRPFSALLSASASSDGCSRGVARAQAQAAGAVEPIMHKGPPAPPNYPLCSMRTLHPPLVC